MLLVSSFHQKTEEAHPPVCPPASFFLHATRINFYSEQMAFDFI